MKPVNILITVAIIPQIQIIIKAPNLLYQGLNLFCINYLLDYY